MLVLYLVLLVGLVLVQLLVRYQVSRMERRFVRVSTTANQMLNQRGLRGGNSSRTDPLLLARQQLELAQMALKRDRAESRYLAWQGWSERLTSLRIRVMGYRGKLLPYLVGAIDVGTVLALLQQNAQGMTRLQTLLNDIGWTLMF